MLLTIQCTCITDCLDLSQITEELTEKVTMNENQSTEVLSSPSFFAQFVYFIGKIL